MTVIEYDNPETEEEESLSGLNTLLVKTVRGDLSRTQLQKSQSLKNQTVKELPSSAGKNVLKNISAAAALGGESINNIKTRVKSISRQERSQQTNRMPATNPAVAPSAFSNLAENSEPNRIIRWADNICNNITNQIDQTVAVTVQTGRKLIQKLTDFKNDLIETFHEFCHNVHDCLTSLFQKCLTFTSGIVQSISRFIRRLFEPPTKDIVGMITPPLTNRADPFPEFISDTKAAARQEHCQPTPQTGIFLQSETKTESILELLGEVIKNFIDQLRSGKKKEQLADEQAERKESIKRAVNDNYHKARLLRPDLDAYIEFPQIDFVCLSPHFEVPDAMDLIDQAEKRRAGASSSESQ